MSSVNEYTALAVMHIKQSQLIEGAGKTEQLRLALIYLPFAEMAQTNVQRRQQQQIQALRNDEK